MREDRTQVPRRQVWESGRIGRGDDDPKRFTGTVRPKAEVRSPPSFGVSVAKGSLDLGPVAGLRGIGPNQGLGGLFGRMCSVDRRPDALRRTQSQYKRQTGFAERS